MQVGLRTCAESESFFSRSRIQSPTHKKAQSMRSRFRKPDNKSQQLTVSLRSRSHSPGSAMRSLALRSAMAGKFILEPGMEDC
jgi:hypothetical protein